MTLVFQENTLLSSYTTFGIGGPARYLAEVRSPEEMKEAILKGRAEGLPLLILGKGSNCLFDDRGFNGLVILNKIDFIEEKGSGIFHVGAGTSFSLLGAKTAKQGWSGLEFASGIPGSVGGAIFMNAGANGGETFQTLDSVEFIDDEGKWQSLLKKELSYAYRMSSFQQMPGAIVGATFALTSLPSARQTQLNILHYRRDTQPLRDKSAGCIFRNPSHEHVGALIEQCGLKGVRIGGAKVSDVHANFIVNTGKASAEDVRLLIAFIKKKVKDYAGIELESEVRMIPYEKE